MEVIARWMPFPDKLILAVAALLVTDTLPDMVPVPEGAKVTSKFALRPGVRMVPETPAAVKPAPKMPVLEMLTFEVPEFVKDTQEKTRLRRLKFFLLPSPRNRARLVLTFRAIDSVCRALWPSDWGFFYQRFPSPVATKPISSETRKAERWSGANHGSIGDSWPIAFSGCPRGPRVGSETKCPRHILPNFSAETRSRTQESREPDGHHRRNDLNASSCW